MSECLDLDTASEYLYKTFLSIHSLKKNKILQNKSVSSGSDGSQVFGLLLHKPFQLVQGSLYLSEKYYSSFRADVTVMNQQACCELQQPAGCLAPTAPFNVDTGDG